VASELDNIPGIGEKTKNDLIKHFKSVKRIRNAEITELSEIVGTNRSSIIYNYFRANLKP
jgi:excinuclease ABC subunit C